MKLRLHRPGNTTGCIAAMSRCCWDNAKKLIDGTSTFKVDVLSHRTGSSIRGMAKERIKKYGDLKVVKSGADPEKAKKACECKCEKETDE